MLACALGCGVGEPPAAAALPAKADPAAAPTEHAQSPWRYLPTLRAAIPNDLTLQPILEVANPDQARLHIVAAVYRPGLTPALRVEQFAFTQHNETGALEPESDPVLVLRTERSQATPPAWEGLRRQVAAAQSQVTRPLGLPVADAAALLPALQSLAATARDPAATPRARVDALAELVRGLDDTLVFESNKLATTIDALATGTWAQGVPRAVSSRRHAIDLPDGSLGLSKKRAGWVLSTVP